MSLFILDFGALNWQYEPKTPTQPLPGAYFCQSNIDRVKAISDSDAEGWEELKKPMLARFLQNLAPKMALHTPNFPHFRPFLPKKAAIEKPPTPKEQS